MFITEELASGKPFGGEKKWFLLHFQEEGGAYFSHGGNRLLTYANELMPLERVFLVRPPRVGLFISSLQNSLSCEGQSQWRSRCVESFIGREEAGKSNQNDYIIRELSCKLFSFWASIHNPIYNEYLCSAWVAVICINQESSPAAAPHSAHTKSWNSFVPLASTFRFFCLFHCCSAKIIDIIIIGVCCDLPALVDQLLGFFSNFRKQSCTDPSSRGATCRPHLMTSAGRTELHSVVAFFSNKINTCRVKINDRSACRS